MELKYGVESIKGKRKQQNEELYLVQYTPRVDVPVLLSGILRNNARSSMPETMLAI